MLPADLGLLVQASSPRVSPDGAWVAYVVTRVDLEGNTYRSRLWLARADGSEPPRPLTAGDGGDGNPAWSPDGRWLAFTRKATADADAPTAVNVLPVDGPGEAAVIATSAAPPHGLAWSPDGRWLAWVARLPDPHPDLPVAARPPRRLTRFFSRLDGEGWVHDRPAHVWLAPADGSAPPLDLTPGEHQHEAPAWLPDSSGLVLAARRHPTWDTDWAVDLYRLGLDGAEPQRLTSATGDYGHPQPSPDGTSVAFLGFDDPGVAPQNGRIGLLDLATGTRRWLGGDSDLSTLPFPGARPPHWLDASSLLCGVDDRGQVGLASFPTGGGRPEIVVGGPRMVTGWDAAAGTIAFTATVPERPAELFAVVGGVERRLSFHTDTFVARVRPRPAERFLAPSTGGAEVDAWILTPPDLDPTRSYPVLLNIHGGPFTQTGERFFDEAQLQTTAGYVVLLSNPRGSAGRDTAWGQAIRGVKASPNPGSGWGSVDADDVLAVVDEALRRYPFCDPDRVGVLGGSYGGYMTSWLVGHTDRFKAACSERAVNNLLTEEYTSDIATLFRSEHGPSYLDDPEEYLRLSPITYVRNIHTPLLIIHSEEDYRCPIEQAEQLWVALRLLGREVEFVRFPGEGHELSRSGSPVHRRMRAEIILEFFDRHLKPER